MSIANLIQGNDCLFQVNNGSAYSTVLCAKSFSITITTSEKEITTEGDGIFQDFDYRSLSYTLNINSALKIQDNVNPVMFDFSNYQLNFLEVPFRIIWVDSNSNVKVFRGTAIVKSVNFITTSSQLTDGTIEMLGKGQYFFEDFVSNPKNLTLIMTGSDSSIAFAKFRLINTDGEIVFQTDTLPQASGSNLSNPFNITVPVESGNYYYFFQVDSETENNNFSLNAPPTVSLNFPNGDVQESTFPTQLYDFTANRTVTFTLGLPVPPPVCVAPSVSPSPSFPDGTVGQPYTYIFSINGSVPLNLSSITKPSWMTLTINYVGGHGQIIASGTPNASGTNINVSFTINNACGSVGVSDLINIASATLVPININANITTGSGTVRVFVNGIQQYVATVSGSGSINVSPGDTVQAQVSGAPSTLHKLLVVDSNMDGNLYTNNGFGTQTFSWTALSGRAYTITGTIQI